VSLIIPTSEALDIVPANLAIITYSSNIDPRTGELRPSALSKLVGDVAIAGWSDTETKFVSASEISFAETPLSTGDLLFNDFSTREIPAERLEAINFLARNPRLHLDNTGLQVEALAESVDDEIVALAMSYHMPRITRIIRYSKAYGLNMRLIAQILYRSYLPLRIGSILKPYPDKPKL
jgi:hypothetical protein